MESKDCFIDRPTNEAINEAEEIIKRDGVAGYLKYLQEKEESWKKVPLNIAVIGMAGVGKSSFTNTIRGLTADDEGAAHVGEGPGTSVIKCYPHPNNKLLQFWDLPGAGTKDFPREKYLEKIKVEKYEFFLLFTQQRFTMDDKWLGGEIKKRGKRYFYVRTKIDDDVSNNKKAHPKNHNEADVINTIRLYLQEHLNDDETPVFLIDNYKPSHYDFSKLEQRLIEDFPALKRSALLLSLCASSEQIVRLKAAEIRSRIWMTSLASAAVAVAPIPGVSLAFDIGLVITHAKFYECQLGLDEKSLERFSKVRSVNLQMMKDILSRAQLNFTVQGLKILAQTIPVVVATTVAEEFAKFVPFIGSLIAAPLSFAGTYYMLKVIIDRMEEAAVKITKLASDGMAH